MNKRYGARVGDDGRFYLKTDDRTEAEAEAQRIANTGWAGKGQLVDFETGERVTYWAEEVQS